MEKRTNLRQKETPALSGSKDEQLRQSEVMSHSQTESIKVSPWQIVLSPEAEPRCHDRVSGEGMRGNE